MRSMKLLVATAIVTALVAGPVLAQDAGGTTTSPAPAAGTMKPMKHHTNTKKHKHTGTKSGTSSTTPSTTPAQ